MTEILVNTYIIILTSVMGYIVYLLKKQNKKRDEDKETENIRRENNSKGIMLILRIQLIEYHDKYMDLGYVPSYVYDNFCEIYHAYHALGGNGMATRMWEEMQSIPIRKDRGYGKQNNKLESKG